MTPADAIGRTRLLILQPTPFCNIDCNYCYLPTRNDRHRMPYEIVEAAVRFVFDHQLACAGFHHRVAWRRAIGAAGCVVSRGFPTHLIGRAVKRSFAARNADERHAD